jgi:hypothetical protein
MARLGCSRGEGRRGGGNAAFGHSEEEESQAADRAGPLGSDRGRVGGYWAGQEAVA